MKLARGSMSSNPFRRWRGVNDITRLDSPLKRASLAGRLVRRLAIPAILALSSQLAGCAPAGPIPPTHVASSDAATARPIFTADQRARLDRLHAALATPPSPAISAGLTVRLAFDEAADLDLFVTDPAQESVYFANSPTRSGGTLIDDRRCDNPSPRIEAVNYASPKPGRYRVGVDFHRVCPKTDLSSKEAKQGLYVVRVDEGARIIEREGMVIPGQFEVIVLEFEVEY